MKRLLNQSKLKGRTTRARFASGNVISGKYVTNNTASKIVGPRAR